MKGRLTALLCAGFLLGCVDDTVLQPDTAARSSMAAMVTLSGQLTAPGGASICEHVTEFVEDSYVHVYDVTGGGWTHIGSTRANCYEDAQFTLDIPSGDDYVIVGEFYAGKHDPFPNRWIDTRVFDLPGNRTRAVRIPFGRVLTGRALMGNQPVRDAQVALVANDYTTIPGVPWGYIGYFEAGADGKWSWWQQEPAMLQRGLQVTASCTDVLGGRLLTAPETFVFPTERKSFNCEYERAHHRSTHDATRTVVTMFPGMLGTNQDDLSGGYGWGLQYVPSPGATPSRNLFRSRARDVRFVFSVNGALVTTGGSGMLQLAPNSEFAPVGGMASVTIPSGRRVRFDLADPTSGLILRQISEDGAGGDYIMLRLRLENSTAARMQVHAGVGADWGINGGGSMDGGVSLGGRLTWVKDHYNDVFVGTVYLGSEHTPRTFLSTWGSREVEDGITVVEGGMTQESASATSFQAFHTAGPFKIAAGGAGTVWIAVVSANSMAELEASANAAGAEYTARTGRPSGLP